MAGIMAKKKQNDVPPDPARAGKKRDYHGKAGMVRLPAWLHDLMQDQADREDRPLTRIVRRLCEEYLRGQGVELPDPPPADSRPGRKRKAP